MPQNTVAPPHSLDRRIEAILARTPEELALLHQEALSRIRPGRPLPEGKTLSDVFVGSLSDINDDDDDLVEALDDLS